MKLSNSKAKVTPSVHAIFKSGVGRLFKSIFACEFVRLKSICCLLLCNYFPSQYKYLQKLFVVGVGETKQIKRSLLKVLLQPIFVSAKHFMRRERVGFSILNVPNSISYTQIFPVSNETEAGFNPQEL